MTASQLETIKQGLLTGLLYAKLAKAPAEDIDHLKAALGVIRAEQQKKMEENYEKSENSP